MRTHLIIPDAHAKPEVSNRRFDWLGELILDVQPDVIIDIGDWADMHSLCSYDKGTKSAIGKSLKEDIEVAKDANKRVFGRIERYNNTRSRIKKKQYKPFVLRCAGNHDERRFERLLEMHPEYEGVFSFESLEYGKYGEQVAPFLQPTIIDNVAYSHYFYDRLNNSAIQTGTTLLGKKHMSAVTGHLHTQWMQTSQRADGRKIYGFSCGCYLDPENWASDWAGPQIDASWWSGLLILHDVRDGECDPQWIRSEKIMKEYS